MAFADFVCVLGSASWGKARSAAWGRSAACADEAGAGWAEARSAAWGKPQLGLVSGGLVFFDRRKRNLGGACSCIPAKDSDGERAHHKENQAGRG